MCGEISDTSNGVALYFDVRTKHLADERFKSTELDNEQLVLGYHKMINMKRSTLIALTYYSLLGCRGPR